MKIENRQFVIDYGEKVDWEADGESHSTQVIFQDGSVCQLLYTINPRDPLNVCKYPLDPQCRRCEIATMLPDRLKKEIIETTVVSPLM